MKGTVFLTITFIASVLSEPYGVCPPDESPVNPTHLPDTHDCKKFYKCLFGEPVLHGCPTGQEWNMDGPYCDYPDRANCVRPIDPNTVSTVKPPSLSTTPSSDKPYGACPPSEDPLMPPTHLPDAESCVKFYKCLYGVPVVQFCPLGHEWNMDQQYCDWPQSANCIRPLKSNSLTVLLPPSPSAGTSKDVCENVSEDPAFLPHESDCNKYYMCSGGHSFLYKCPAGLYFNLEVNVCDYPENVVCEHK